jgi:hypothetical protein
MSTQKHPTPEPMRCEISQTFYFDAAHTLKRAIETESSKRIHGHTYNAEVFLAGEPDPVSGMVMDLGLVRREIAVLRRRERAGSAHAGELVPVHLPQAGCAFAGADFGAGVAGSAGGWLPGEPITLIGICILQPMAPALP